jgi:hypothetical protein
MNYDLPFVNKYIPSFYKKTKYIPLITPFLKNPFSSARRSLPTPLPSVLLLCRRTQLKRSA